MSSLDIEKSAEFQTAVEKSVAVCRLREQLNDKGDCWLDNWLEYFWHSIKTFRNENPRKLSFQLYKTDCLGEDLGFEDCDRSYKKIGIIESCKLDLRERVHGGHYPAACRNIKNIIDCFWKVQNTCLNLPEDIKKYKTQPSSLPPEVRTGGTIRQIRRFLP